MSPLVIIEPEAGGAITGSDAADAACVQIEAGCILVFPQTPPWWGDEDGAFLLERHEVSGFHKNIVYRPDCDRIAGLGRRASVAAERLRRILRAYARGVDAWLSGLLPRYARAWRVDLTSFRPLEEEGRKLPLRARNDLLHIDAFPSRPTNGARILRVFTNVNPAAPRRWVTSDPLDVSLDHIRTLPGFPGVLSKHTTAWNRIRCWVSRCGRTAGLPLPDRSAYDECMLRLHDFLKRSADFQRSCRRHTCEFPPHSSWVLFTDTVPHAALSGRFALEQTFIVPRDVLIAPERSPLALLERIAGVRLV
jgi:hypothetical protein